METTSLSCRNRVPISCDGVTAGRDHSLGKSPPINPVRFSEAPLCGDQEECGAHAMAGGNGRVGEHPSHPERGWDRKHRAPGLGHSTRTSRWCCSDSGSSGSPADIAPVHPFMRKVITKLCSRPPRRRAPVRFFFADRAVERRRTGLVAAAQSASWAAPESGHSGTDVPATRRSRNVRRSNWSTSKRRAELSHEPGSAPHDRNATPTCFSLRWRSSAAETAPPPPACLFPAAGARLARVPHPRLLR